MKKRQKINQKMVSVILVSILLVVICIILVALYLPGWSKQVREIQFTRTAVVVGEITQLVQETNTAIVAAEQGTLLAARTLTAVPTFTLTPTLIPTPTSAPSAIICSAKVSRNDGAYYPFPRINSNYQRKLKTIPRLVF